MEQECSSQNISVSHSTNDHVTGDAEHVVDMFRQPYMSFLLPMCWEVSQYCLEMQLCEEVLRVRSQAASNCLQSFDLIIFLYGILSIG